MHASYKGEIVRSSRTRGTEEVSMRAYSTGCFAMSVTVGFVVVQLDIILKNPNAIPMPDDLKTMWIFAIFLSWLMTFVVLDITRGKK